MSFTVKLNDPQDVAKVISIEVARKRSLYIKSAECQHTMIRLDRLESKLLCRDCGKEINPIEWIAMMAENWHYVDDLMRRYREGKAAYEAKQRCRCEHCGKITSVRPATAAQIRQFKGATKQDEGSKL